MSEMIIGTWNKLEGRKKKSDAARGELFLMTVMIKNDLSSGLHTPLEYFMRQHSDFTIGVP